MPLTKDEIEKFKNELLKEREKIVAHIKKLGSGVDFGHDTDHLEEEADEMEELTNESGIKKSYNDTLRRVEAALEKMVTGEYGICEQCKGPIGARVLEVDPESRYCQDCKKTMRG